jgi:hypothetical protein
MITPIKHKVIYRQGLFKDSNLESMAKVINMLIAKVNEQSEIINKLIDEKAK